MSNLGWVAGAVMVLLAFGGCSASPTENQKQLNAMNEDAGDQLSKHSDPDVAQAGKDIKDNSTVLEKTLLGPPQVRILYTPEFAAKLRAATMKEFEENQPWYKKFAGTLLSVLGILAMGGMFVARFYPPAAAVMAVASPVIGALTQIKQAADASSDDKLHIDQITPIISSLTKIPKIGPLIADKLKDLHLEQIIHAPEAPDVPAVQGT